MLGANKRRFLIPEVIQASNMDCGPASLKCLLAGFGIDVSYERLRDACQTDVDGTSINTIEEVAARLGLDAIQVMLPVDHLLFRESNAFPALAVVKLPNGNTHFLVIWRRIGRVLQIMNPSSGRIWKRAADFSSELYVHQATVDAAAWRQWAGSVEFIRMTRGRMRYAGISDQTIDAVIENALHDPTWRSIARLDASIRGIVSLVEAAAIRPGSEAERAFMHWLQPRGTSIDLPQSYWSVSESSEVAGALTFRGAVILHVRGIREARTTDTEDTTYREILDARGQRSIHPLQELFRILRHDGLVSAGLITLVWALTSCELLVQTLLLRSVFGLGARLVSRTQLLGGMLALLTLVFLLFLNRVPSAGAIFRWGRLVEVRIRAAFLHKLPRLGDRYFQSRLTADMAERGHSIHILKSVPILASRIVTSAFELVMTTAGIVWIEPRAAPVAIIAGTAALAIPLALQPLLTERDLRVRSHVGALGRFYLDAMLGLTTIRAHAAEDAMRKEQRLMVAEWRRASLASLRSAISVEAVQVFFSTAAAAAILITHLKGRSDAGGSLLLVYWALNLPVLGSVFVDAARRYPESRNTMLRLLEALQAHEESADQVAICEPTKSSDVPPVSIAFEHVTVRSGGETILKDVTLRVGAGEHVAIVGSSGAGKSSLLAVILGWRTPTAGTLLIDDHAPSAADFAGLRATTAWVDPVIQLWDSSLFENLVYGGTPSSRFADVLSQADLRDVVRHLPDGLQTRLGEGGRLLSGGEGQRARLGRAMARDTARLVLLDEAFRGLDRGKRRLLLDRARTLWRDATLLCVTHDVDETSQFDRVVVIENGRIVEDGSPCELADTRCSRYALLLAREAAIRSSAWSSERWQSLQVDEDGLVERR